jgi:hypothetical protein
MGPIDHHTFRSSLVGRSHGRAPRPLQVFTGAPQARPTISGTAPSIPSPSGPAISPRPRQALVVDGNLVIAGGETALNLFAVSLRQPGRVRLLLPSRRWCPSAVR